MTKRLALLLSALAFSSSVGIAVAADQPTGSAASAEKPTTPVDQQVLKRLSRSIQEKLSQSPLAAAGAPAGYSGATLDGIGNVPIGINTFHAFNCVWFTDGVNNFEFVFPLEGGFFVVANNLFVAQTFLTGCVNGDFQQVNVVNSVTGAFNEVITFPFR